MMAWRSSRHHFRLAVAGLLALLAGACTAVPPARLAPPPPLPPGEARFWFYRVFLPDDTWSMPAIAMNGRTVGYGIPGESFYRDVPAGRYHLTVETVGRDYGQSQNVAVLPGQQVFVQIASAPDWDSNLFSGVRLPTYYVMIMPPDQAALQLRETTYGNGE